MIKEYEDYLYDEKLELLTNKFMHTYKSIDEIIFVDDLFHNGIDSSSDILCLLQKLKERNTTSLKFKFKDGYVDIPLKRIYGLANKDDTYFDSYDIAFHNPQYPLASFYLDLIKILEDDLNWENDY